MLKEYTLRIGDKNHRVQIESYHNGQARVLVDGSPFTVAVESSGSTPPRPAAVSAATPIAKETVVSPSRPASHPAVVGGEKALRAPMPGVIRKILVNAGDTVKAGQPLLVMEAMKMENELVAPADGRVSAIAVAVGASLNTGDLIISFE